MQYSALRMPDWDVVESHETWKDCLTTRILLTRILARGTFHLCYNMESYVSKCKRIQSAHCFVGCVFGYEHLLSHANLQCVRFQSKSERIVCLTLLALTRILARGTFPFGMRMPERMGHFSRSEHGGNVLECEYLQRRH